MNTIMSENQWRDSILNIVLKAFAFNPDLNKALVFKGARILNQHLGRGRFSLDIDSSFSTEFIQEHKSREQWREFIEGNTPKALKTHFNSQEIIRYEYEGLEIIHRPKKNPHSRGWDGLILKIKIKDSSYGETPVLEIDITAPEKYDHNSIKRLVLEGREVNAYSLERCVGEKFRAYLSSTDAYRKKIKEPKMVPLRVKDLYDISLTKRIKILSQNHHFWKIAGEQFNLACETRYVDCNGLKTFTDTWDIAKNAYESEATLHTGELISWNEARQSIEDLICFFETQGLFPIDVPL